MVLQACPHIVCLPASQINALECRRFRTSLEAVFSVARGMGFGLMGKLTSFGVSMHLESSWEGSLTGSVSEVSHVTNPWVDGNDVLIDTSYPILAFQSFDASARAIDCCSMDSTRLKSVCC